MLIQLLRGNLPWQGIGGANKLEKYSNIMELKIQTVEEILCKDLPGTLFGWLDRIRLILQISQVCKGPRVRREAWLQAPTPRVPRPLYGPVRLIDEPWKLLVRLAAELTA